MNQGRYVFTQLMDFLPRKYFEWLVKKYEGNKYVESGVSLQNVSEGTPQPKVESSTTWADDDCGML